MNTKIVVDSSASLYTLQGVDFECVPLKIITDDRRISWTTASDGMPWAWPRPAYL